MLRKRDVRLYLIPLKVGTKNVKEKKFHYLSIKGYLRYKTILCHQVVLNV